MRRVSFLLLGVVLGSACATSRSTHLATVNGEQVMPEDLKAEFSRRHAALEKFLGGNEAVVREYLDAVIDRRLFIQEADRLGLQDEPDIAEDVRDLEGRKVEERLFALEVTEKAVVADEDVKAAHAKLDSLYHVREISTWTREEADAILAELKGGADFELLARTRSRSPSARYGGRLRPLGWGNEDEAFEAALFPLPEGGTSEPFAVKGGWRIVRLDKREARPELPELEKVESFIRDVLKRRKAVSLERALHESLRVKYAGEIVCSDCSFEAIQRARKEKQDDVAAATWTGGALTRGVFAKRVKLEKVAELAPERRNPQIRELLEVFLRDQLLRMEGLARGLAAEPAIASAVKRYREQLMEARLFEGYVYRGIVITDDDVKAHYDQNREKFVIPEKRKVSQIILKDLATANAVRTRLLDGAAFDDVATESATPGEKQGGDTTGWLTAKDLPAGFSAVFAVGRDEIPPPIRSEIGFHVVKVTAIVPARQMSLEEIREGLREELMWKARRQRTVEWTQKLRQTAKIDVSKRGVRAYVDSNPGADPTDIPAGPSMGAGHGGGMAGGHGAGAEAAPPAAGQGADAPLAPAASGPAVGAPAAQAPPASTDGGSATPTPAAAPR